MTSIFNSRPDKPLDLDALRKRSGDTKARAHVRKELERFSKLSALRHKLGDMRFAPAAIDDLKKEGIRLSAGLIDAGIYRWEEKPRQQLQEEAALEITKSLSARVEDDVKRCLRNTVSEIEADLDALESAARKVCDKYGYTFEPGQVSVSLAHAVNVLNAEIEKPFDLSWHYQPSVALGHHFEGGL
jgi:hypothetical protein